MSFSRRAAGVENLVGKFVKFYVDKKKNTLAFKVMDEKELSSLKGYRKITKYTTPKWSVIRVGIPAVCFENLKITNTKKLKVLMWESTSPLDRSVYYYVQL